MAPTGLMVRCVICAVFNNSCSSPWLACCAQTQSSISFFKEWAIDTNKKKRRALFTRKKACFSAEHHSLFLSPTDLLHCEWAEVEGLRGERCLATLEEDEMQIWVMGLMESLQAVPTLQDWMSGFHFCEIDLSFSLPGYTNPRLPQGKMFKRFLVNTTQ